MAVDWLKVKNDYINGGGSYRKLATKYGVTFGALRTRAEREGWASLKEEHQHKLSIRTAQKSIEKTADAVANAIAEEAAMKVKLRSGLLRLAVDWMQKQESIGDTSDYRRMVQSCIELGVLDVDTGGSTEDDGLLHALGSNAKKAFATGDDSDMLPKEKGK